MRFLLLVLLTVSTGAGAAADAAIDCNQFENRARQIRGCTEYIRGGKTISENLAVAYTNRGIAHASNGDKKLALADFREAIHLAPQSPYPYYNRANAFYDLQDYARALEDYDAAIDRSPELALAYYNRGLTHEKMGKRDKSIEDFRKALTLDPSSQLAKKRLDKLGIKR
ncbi:tetratricopeptide repeat protein [Leptospira interrogans]